MDVLVTRGTIIGDLLDRNPQAAQILTEAGMHCLYCPAARGETLEEASQVHGIDCGPLLERPNGK